jgi:hypothetical protein
MRNMPTEQEHSNSHETGLDPVKQAQEALSRFLADTALESPKFSAFCDFVTYSHLAKVRSNKILDVQAARQALRERGGYTPENEALAIEEESALRELDTTMGTFTTHILLQKGRIKGYARYYEQVDLLGEALENAYQVTGEEDYSSAAGIDLSDALDTFLTQASNQQSI